jgi:hypothetical protein
MFSLGACDKPLQEVPKTFIAPDQFFKTAEQCTQAVNGLYASLYDLFGQNLWMVTQPGGDLVMQTRNQASVNLSDFEYTFSASNPGEASGIWNTCYASIKNDNLAISRIQDAPIADTLRLRLLGEAKFLRALNYFVLTNVFGDVPLWTQELDIDKVSSLPRAPLDSVRAQVIQDLKDAVSGLPLSYDASETGRITKGAAQTLLAKVYLYQEDWKDAQAAAQAVEDSHQYQLLTNYADLYDVTDKNKNNQESIFEIQYDRDAATNTNIKVNYYYAWFFPLKDAGSVYSGVDFGNPLLQGYEIFYPSSKLVAMFEPGDTRKDVVLGYGYKDQTFNRGPKPGRPFFGPKFWDVLANDRASDKDFYVLRYADVILINAEAMIAQQNKAGSISELNKIRNRAGLPDLDPAISVDSVVSEVRKERAIEFVGECQRRWDLNRWGILTAAVQSVKEDNPVGAANIQPYNNLYPIPYNQIVLNPNLIQNPGY